MEKRKFFILCFIIIFAIGLVISLYFLYHYSKQCFSKDCFEESLTKCKRASYVLDTEETIMKYVILGKTNFQESKTCEISVELFQVKRGSIELSQLEKQTMTCFVALGFSGKPEENLKNCHGILKEEIQEIMIKRLHSQIIENLGKISDEASKVL